MRSHIVRWFKSIGFGQLINLDVLKNRCIKLSSISLFALCLVANPLIVSAKTMLETYNKTNNKSSSKSNVKPTILVFGDSLSASYGISQDQGWVNLLAQRLTQKRYSYKLVNVSISGETTSGGLSRFKQSIKQHKPSVVILELGANDGLRGLNATDTFNNLDSMISQAKPAKVLLLGMKIPPNYGLKYSEQFSDNYVKLAKKNNVKLVPFMLDGIAGNRDLVQQDGLHPTAAAQPLILENIWVELKKII